MQRNKPDLQNIGNAGEYYIASVLSANGFTATITLGRAEKYDIIAISPKGNTIKLQVKTGWYKIPTWRLNIKNENHNDSDLFYAFVRLNEMKEHPEFWIVPSDIVSNLIKESHVKWLKLPAKNGSSHNDNPGRIFSIKHEKFYPDYWNENVANQYYKNTSILSKE